VGLVLSELLVACSAASSEGDPRDHGVAGVEELVKVVGRPLEFPKSSQRLGDLVAAPANARVHGLRRVHVLHLRIHELEKTGRVGVEQTLVVDPAHQLDVLP
jgi:hypothetical protein